MTVLPAGTPAPRFSLQRLCGAPFTNADLAGVTTVLAFYPFAFSPVCTEQLSIYDAVRGDLADQGAVLYGVSCDAVHAQEAFRLELGIGIEQLSDSEPRGRVSEAFGILHPGGFSQRALVVIDRKGMVRWSYEAPSPAELPGANLIFDGLGAM